MVWPDEYGYAGTLDYLCKICGVPYLIDLKTFRDVYPDHEIQVSAYSHALAQLGEDEFNTPAGATARNLKRAILQVGYRRNKAGYKFTDVEDRFVPKDGVQGETATRGMRGKLGDAIFMVTQRNYFL